MKSPGRNILLSLYGRIFREEITGNVESFFKNLGYIILGFGVAKLFTGTFNILAGRLLGPVEYGKFALINSIALFLSIPMFLGISAAMVKYNAERDDFARQAKIISTSSILVLACSLFSILVYILLKSYLLRLFSTSLTIFYLALFFTLVYVPYTLFVGVMQSLYWMKKRAVVEAVFGFLLLAALFLFIHLAGLKSVKAIVFSFYLAYGLSALLVIFLISRYLSFKFDGLWAKRILKYSSYGTLAGISSVFLTNTDKVMINRYMLPGDLGIYRAYYVPSLGIALSLLVMFNTVFFPSASRSKNKLGILRRINRFSPWLFLLGSPVVALFTCLVLKLYGESYPVNFILLALFAGGAALISLHSFYVWLIAAVGGRGMKVCAWTITFSALLNIALNCLLIPVFGLEGAISATIIAYLISTLILFSKRGMLYQEAK